MELAQEIFFRTMEQIFDKFLGPIRYPQVCEGPATWNRHKRHLLLEQMEEGGKDEKNSKHLFLSSLPSKLLLRNLMINSI